ncbi:MULTISPECIES: hypothetical protein [unclassified Brevundimonas]|uniref:hypothetical protein n=1 Tax=unclassified Brevundimonas TaxID=2622653 RepID=UPI000CFC47C1|nr:MULTISPECIES: hypothetical protein [unclassified Brevundimonas]PRA32607.1 hypothetical protein CQ024_05135 [Brevundimonas sp. MYb27]PQZ77570.1 hypothetical protein CQ026_12580 [Brevundimonas sp. MYb31]PRB16817.1 hypothetical protein CQ039_03980 [Brevundimonas sp. MYb52]PRB37469.1 hypothetical protein CQ035_04015 [Brevundimonas sp. MYb46]PRB47623.1 hypothetical protein CQ028_09905 [Brevundimonas sp. MYb33]
MTMKATTATIATIGLAVLLGGGWMLWRSTSIAHGPAPSGPSIHVEVVAPIEPELAPSPILAVGELSDGYEHDPERMLPPAPYGADETALDSAWVEPTAPLALPSVVVISEPAPAPAPRVVRLDPDDYSFGFDRPLPEAVAETAPIAPTGAAADINGAR